MKKILKIILTIIVVAFLSIGIFFGIQTKTNPRVKLLMSTIQFTESTLKNPSYLFYEIDIMELFHDYFNSAVSMEGSMSVYDVKNLGFAVSLDLEGKRSFSQKRFSSLSSASVLGIDAGNSEVYIEDDIIYILIPDMDLYFAFPTGMNLFTKMPDLTHDINREWFHENASNIFEFTGQIGIEETGNLIRETNGEKSLEYVITIPEGTGAFLWELLGMDMPEYDVVVSMYLNSKNQLRRMEIDLGKVMEGASVVLEGEDVGTLITYMELPDGERMHITMMRAGDKKNTMRVETVYDTNADIHYNIEGSFTWEEMEKGVKLKMKEMDVLHGKEILAKFNFNGEVIPLDEEPDVFEGLTTDLDSIERLDWKAIRDDVDGFTKDMLDKLKDVRKNK